ncbi:MAG: inosine-5-monophosphate dehydrogenase [Henriciella sp.]|jgi:CBS domain-containing protein|uniref:CBS domain-containing protein n=1 Tax=Henriciella sp. TaxID=1968823 RepID=UPI000C116A03|nr:CBS domain-containing protein [Henriciella sp.]MBF35328.1 inosine-5-monophosphate dehydrogenase [Hyphomonadaceae bacterium]MBK75880.1 inosine-5-monophosphate dehydrogenase [Henriciella sp.]PHR74946.1 MAG: inosine-5-monophosphate dehydrogenase [Henriciella sp.]|tara:strand:+ start:1849 stop:2277 length:429 start_codon:yes stop_codon:yes gene_type:complete
MLIEQILKTKGGNVLTIDASQTLAEAARFLDEERIGAVVAMSGEGLAGVLSERDILRQLARHGAAALQMSVEESMTRGVITANPTESLDQCLGRMTDRRVRHLPVMRDGKLAGIVSIGDLVKWKIEETRAEADAMADYIKGQ